MRIDHSVNPARPILERKEHAALVLAASVLRGLATITDPSGEEGVLGDAAIATEGAAARYAPDPPKPRAAK